MKFTVTCSAIRQEIEYALNFSSQRNSLSISSNVLLENNNDCLYIKATDGKMGFLSEIPVNTIVPGSTTVFCDKFVAVLKNLPDIELEFAEEDGKLTIRPTNSEGDKKSLININIRTMESSKFPALLINDDIQYFSLAQRDFFDMIDKTSFSVGEDETRKFLTGVYIEKKDGKLVTVATDGRRLSCVRRTFEQEIPDFMPAIVPVKFLSMVKSIGSGEGIFSMAIEPTAIYAKIENRTIYSALIMDSYPNYEKVIPKETKYSCKINKEDMEKAITLISILVENKSKRIIIDLNTDGVMVSGENADFGDSKQIIKCEYTGPEARISFNYNLLLTPIKKIDSEFFQICYNTPSAAMIITPEPEKDYLFVLMPMQV